MYGAGELIRTTDLLRPFDHGKPPETGYFPLCAISHYTGALPLSYTRSLMCEVYYTAISRVDQDYIKNRLELE